MSSRLQSIHTARGAKQHLAGPEGKTASLLWSAVINAFIVQVALALPKSVN